MSPSRDRLREAMAVFVAALVIGVIIRALVY